MRATRTISLPLLWGVLGFIALLSSAIARLTPYAIDALGSGLTAMQWAAVIVYTGFMVYSEGYKGFHRMTAPRVVERGLALSAQKSVLWKIFAPLFCMGLIGANRKRLMTSWAIVVMVVGLIISVRFLNQPWRGIVDTGVVAGLALGVASILFFLVRAIAGQAPGVNPDLPDRLVAAK